MARSIHCSSRIGPVLYKIDTRRRNNWFQTFHANMLWKWNPPAATAGLTDEIARFDDEDEVACWKEMKQATRPYVVELKLELHVTGE